MNITKQHVIGFAVGVGVAGGTYYAYTKNKSKVDDFLGSYGINVDCTKEIDLSNVCLEELVYKKEYIEDLIAEKELENEESVVAEENEATVENEEKLK